MAYLNSTILILILLALGFSSYAEEGRVDPIIEQINKSFDDVLERIILPSAMSQLSTALMKMNDEKKILGGFVQVTYDLDVCKSSQRAFADAIPLLAVSKLATVGIEVPSWPKNVPALPTLTIVPEQALPLTALGRTLTADKSFDAALALVSRIRDEAPDNEPLRIGAMLIAGEVYLRTKHAKRAVDWLAQARSQIGELSKPYDRMTPGIRILSKQINLFYDEAKRVSDIEDFGEAWVLFRDAEQARRRSGDYLEAYRLYQAILKKYPGTQYSEAAEAYSIRTLLIFAGNGYEARLMNRMDSIQKRFDALLCATKSMEKDHFSSESIREQKELLAEQKAVMGLVQSLPAKGAGAFEMASKQSRDFLISEPFGLYRGEILYEMGNWLFEQQKEPTQARAYYERASNWFIEVTLKDKILDDFSWEPRITKIAAPPPSMKMQDDWGRWVSP